MTVQRSTKVGPSGLVNFITVVAYHLCPSLPEAFTQPGASTLADLCMLGMLFQAAIFAFSLLSSAPCTDLGSDKSFDAVKREDTCRRSAP